MKCAIGLAMCGVVFLAVLGGGRVSVAEEAGAAANVKHARTVQSSGKWQNTPILTDVGASAKLKTHPMLKVDVTVPADADNAGWFQVKLAINADGITRTESPKWLLDGAPRGDGINMATITWDIGALAEKLPDHPKWFKIELVSQGDRARTIYVDNLRCTTADPADEVSLLKAGAGKTAEKNSSAGGATPFPDNDSDYPGKGVVRKFGFMVGERNAFWARRSTDQGAIVFAGDSLTGGWKNLAESFPKLKVANRGLGGDVSRGLLWRFQEDVLDLHPKAIVICIGNNDLTAMGKPADMLSNLTDMLAMVDKADAETPVVLCTIPSSANPKAPVKVADRDAMNEGIRKIVSQRKNTYLCELYAATANADGTPNLEYYYKDKLHLSNVGHAKWAELLTPIFKELKFE